MPDGNPLIGRVGFGSGTMIAQGYGQVDEDAARGAVEAAYQAGVRFYDTAHFYGSGRSEAIVGEILQGRRDEVRLCTKGGVRYTDPTNLLTLVCDSSYDALRRFMEESLTRLRTDHVDVYLLHQFDPALTPEQQMENLLRLKEEGLARDVGFCNFGAEAARRALATGIPTAVEYSFSLLDHRYLNELAASGERGGLRITYGSYVHGLLSEDFTDDHEFDPDDWRGRSRREGRSGTSGNVFFAGDAFAANLAIARRLRALADPLGLSLAAFVLALTVRQPYSDVALFGCRDAAEVADGLSGLSADLDDETLARAAEILATANRPAENLLGL
ncbi:aldo/keto reductase [Nonomuraea ferruginea]|uniref:Aldo/keto reductase n=1 Tax=Nonomuraea ferruginea TaxID=46174 RepID=A0ABT4TB19_9ACTN|nr:aldo/keto reductase [Nonomuraea ferruginea]MDA0646338.1 aldo/keto reductase [Nonomuraea ferruginea]